MQRGIEQRAAQRNPQRKATPNHSLKPIVVSPLSSCLPTRKKKGCCNKIIRRMAHRLHLHSTTTVGIQRWGTIPTILVQGTTLRALQSLLVTLSEIDFEVSRLRTPPPRARACVVLLTKCRRLLAFFTWPSNFASRTRSGAHT